MDATSWQCHVCATLLTVFDFQPKHAGTMNKAFALSGADLNAFGAKPSLSLISKQHIAKFGVRVLTAFVPVLQEALRV